MNYTDRRNSGSAPQSDLNPADLGIIGGSPAIREAIRVTRQVARTRACVLIVGETGTGKELIAKAVHKWSPVSSGPYIRVNCGALSESLLESELFGHVKGAFTNAIDNRTGRFEAADHGSIFLDEINSTTPKLQVKLLRVLQEGEFERVGDIKTIKVSTRIIAATNRDLLEEIDNKRFREDLYYRLNVVPIELPALRDRREDIPELARFFLKRYCEIDRKPSRTIHSEAMKLLVGYDWPGNVRELQNYIERGVVLYDADELISEHLPPQLRGEAPKRSIRVGFHAGSNNSGKADLSSMVVDLVRQGLREPRPENKELHRFLIEQVDSELIRQVMEACNFVQLKAAERLGINRNTLHQKVEKYQIKSRELNPELAVDEAD